MYVDELVLWDVSDPRNPRELHRVGDLEDVRPLNFRSATFSPDGRVVAINDAPDQGWVTFVDVARGDVLRRRQLGGQIGPLVYSPDGEAIVTVRYIQEQSLLVLDAATGNVQARRPTALWPGGWGFVHGGRRVVTESLPSSSNRQLGPTTLELWEATTLEPFGEPVTIAGTAGNLGGANADGSKLVLGTNDGHGLLWDLDPRHWAARACRVAGRNLTRKEWNQYLPGRDYHRTCAA